ncbi:protein kinase [Candidatus Uabimicrobium sp. HlEnr_7]|uniref:protein kinase domain-containing protein n=1 Tax=Candidatus Uabimicrobium helgolandensis TaxID=3095367 RepID=UPI0035587740
MSNTILLLDEDNENRKRVKLFLEEYSCTVYEASDVKIATEFFFTHEIDMIVSSVKLGWDFCPIVRESTSTRPIIILAKENSNYERVHSKILRADACVLYQENQQFIEHLSDVAEFVEKKMHREKRQISMAGNLADIPFIENLQNLLHYSKTGCIKIQNGALHGKVFFEEGKCVHAEIDPHYSGVHALYNILYWQNGKFQFLEGELSSEQTINQDTTGILLEWTRLDDEINRLFLKSGAFTKEQIFLIRDCIFSGRVSETTMHEVIKETIKENKTFLDILQEIDVFSAEEISFFCKRVSTINRKKTLRAVAKHDHLVEKLVNDYSEDELQLQDFVLQRLISSLSLLSMKQINECIRVKNANERKSLCDVILDKGYLRGSTIKKLEHFQDEEGDSLLFDYNILQKIGEGEKSIVYKAKRKSDDKDVAIKIFIPGIEESGRNVLRFIQEAKTSSRLNHKYIVPAIDFGIIYELYYTVQEYAIGDSLNHTFTQSGALPEKTLLLILRQLKEGLRYLWQEHKIVHRDLTPRNIIFDGKNIKICDFGLVKKINDTKSKELSPLTGTGMFIGTPGYMAPEILTSKDITFRVDLYALGMTLYVLSTGKAHVASTLARTQRISMAPYQTFQLEPPKSRRPELSTAFSHFVMKLLDPIPLRRCKSLDEFESDIDRVLVGKNPKRLPQSNRKKTIAIAVIFTFLISIIISFYIANQKKIQKIKLDIILEEKTAKEHLTSGNLAKANHHLLKMINYCVLLSEEQASECREKVFEQWLSHADKYNKDDNVKSWENAKICYDYANVIRSTPTVLKRRKEITQRITRKLEKIRQEQAFAKFSFSINRIWLSSAQNKKNTTFLTGQKVWLFAEITVDNYLPEYELFFHYGLSSQKQNRILKLNIPTRKTFVIKQMLLQSSDPVNDKVYAELACDKRLKKIEPIILSIKHPVAKGTVWGKPRSLFAKHYQSRLAKWKKNSGVWAPDEESLGIFALGSGEITRSIKYKKAWRIYGKIKGNKKNKEICIQLSLLNSKKVTLSFQPIAGSYLVMAFEPVGKKRKVFKSKMIKMAGTFDYVIENYIHFVRIKVQNQKLCDIPVTNKIKQLMLCVKKSQSTYFAKLIWQGAK